MVRYFSRSLLAILCQASLGSSVLLGAVSVAQAKDIQFNTDVLDLKDRDNIDLGQFSHQGFILPGTYDLALSLNNQVQPARPVLFLAPDDDLKGSQVCLSKEMVELLGLTRGTGRMGLVVSTLSEVNPGERSTPGGRPHMATAPVACLEPPVVLNICACC